MQKIFKFWFIGMLILAIIASFIVDIESPIFGLLLLPLIIVLTAIIILGYVKRK